MDRIEFIEHLGILKIVPGDIVVVKVGKPLSSDQYQAIHRTVKNVIGSSYAKVVILEDGVDIGVVRKEVIGEY